MVKHLCGAAAVVAVTTFGVASFGALGGTLGFLLAAVLVVTAATRTSIDVEKMEGSFRDVLIVRLGGPLTFFSQGELVRRLEGPPWPSFVVIDVLAVPFVDGGGVSEIEHLVDFLAIRGGQVAVIGAANLRDPLLRANVVRRLVGQTVFQDLDSALDALPNKTEPVYALAS